MTALLDLPDEILDLVAEGLCSEEGHQLRPNFACLADLLSLGACCKALQQVATRAEAERARARLGTPAECRQRSHRAAACCMFLAEAARCYRVPKQALLDATGGDCWLTQKVALRVALQVHASPAAFDQAPCAAATLDTPAEVAFLRRMRQLYTL